MSTAIRLRDRIVGFDHPVPLLDGTTAPYLNLDNAASTPALRDVMDAVEEWTPSLELHDDMTLLLARRR